MDKRAEKLRRAARLKQARIAAGYRGPFSAAKALGWHEEAYKAHETGRNSFDNDAGRSYARAFGVSYPWLMTGVGAANDGEVPIVGLAGAGPDGSILFDVGQGELGEAPMPPGGSPRTVALEVRGDSMRGIADDGWLVYYEDRRDPPTEDLLGMLCIVGLTDGRVLIKVLMRGRRKNLFDLESVTAPVLRDVKVAWAAAVIAIVPRYQARRRAG